MADESMIYASLEDYKIKISDLRAELETLTIGSQQYNAVLLELNNTTKEMSDKTEDAKVATLSLKDNFSDIVSQITGSVGPMSTALGGVTTGIAGFQTAWSNLTKVFMANPWVAALTVLLGALMTIIKKVSDAIKGNETTSNKWSKAMATFQPILDAITNAFDWLAEVFVDAISTITDNLPGFLRNFGKGAKKVLDFIGGIVDAVLFLPKVVVDAVTSAMPTIMKVITGPMRALSSILSALGAEDWAKSVNAAADSVTEFAVDAANTVNNLIKNAGSFIKELGTKIDSSMNSLAGKMEHSRKLKEREIQLTKDQRQATDELAQSQLREGQIRDKIAKETDPKKQIELYKQLADEQNKAYDKQAKLAKQRYDLAVEYAALTPNDKAANDNLANLKANITKIEAERAAAMARTHRRATKMQERVNKAMSAGNKKAQQEALNRIAEEERAAIEASKKIFNDLHDKIKGLDGTTDVLLFDLTEQEKRLKLLGKLDADAQKTIVNQRYKVQKDDLDARIKMYEDAFKDEKLLDDERNKLTIEYNKLKNQQYKLDKQHEYDLLAIQINAIKTRRDQATKKATNEQTVETSASNQQYYEELKQLNDLYEQGKISYNDYLAGLETAKQNNEDRLNEITAKANQERIDALKKYWEDIVAQYGADGPEALEAHAAYEKAMTDETKRQTDERIKKNKEEMKTSLQRLKQNMKIAQQLSRSVANVMGTVSDIMQANIEEKVKRGEISEEEAEKEFENVKKLQIAEAIINTLTGALQAQMSVWAPDSQVHGVWTKIALSAALGIQTLASGYAQVQKIRNTTFGGGGSGSAQPTIITGAATPLLNEAQDLNELDAMYVTGRQPQDTRVYVLESDITNAQNNQKVRVTESTF